MYLPGVPTSLPLLPFGPVTVGFDERVLRPRPWTLAQSEWAAELARDLPPGPLLELGCGVGHIGQAAAVLSGRDLVQVDDLPAACEWARANAKRAELGERVEVRCGSFEAVLRPGERYPLAIADPPYVPTAEVSAFPEDPPEAIDGGPDGLEAAESFVVASLGHLALEGVVLVQLWRPEQADALVARLGRREGPPPALREVRTVGSEGALVLLAPA